MYNVLNVVSLWNILATQAINVRLIHLKSEFDIRSSPSEEKHIAGCVVSGVPVAISEIFFLVGEHEFRVPVPPVPDAANGVMARRRYNGTLVTQPLVAFDKRWVSCLIRVDDTAVSSDSSFPLDIKYLPSVIGIELLNAFQTGDKWTINEGDQFNIICRVDGNPRPKVKVAVNGVRSRKFGVRAVRSAGNMDIPVACRTVRSKIRLKTSTLLSINYLDDPFVSVSKLDNEIQYTCHCNGFPTPDIKWTRQPKPVRLLSHRHESKRSRAKLRFWDYAVISNNSRLTFGSERELKALKDRILICTAKNIASSKSAVIHKTDKLDINENKALNIWEGVTHTLSDNGTEHELIYLPESSPESSFQGFKKQCANDVCQLKQKHQFGVQCKRKQLEISAGETTNNNKTGLKIDLDGKRLDTFQLSDDKDGVFTIITLPLDEELQRSARGDFARKKRKKNCIHKISCSEGNKELDSTRIIPNYIRKPCIGLRRHHRYKKIDSTGSIARKKGADVDLVCYADSIPEASVYWTKKNQIVSVSHLLYLSNLTRADAGIYFCYAANSYDTKVSALRLRIH